MDLKYLMVRKQIRPILNQFFLRINLKHVCARTCLRASFVTWEISEAASSWLFLDCLLHDMTVHSFPAITKSISFCSRYVCNVFAKKSTATLFLYEMKFILKFQFSTLIFLSKAPFTLNLTGTAFESAWSFLEKHRNRCQKKWRPRDMIPWAFRRPGKTRPPSL